MKNITEYFINEKQYNVNKIMCHYYFNNDDAENMYTNQSATKAHKSVASKFTAIVKKYVDKVNVNAEGHESTLEIWAQFDNPIEDVKGLINDLSKSADNVFVEYISDDDYQTN